VSLRTRSCPAQSPPSSDRLSVLRTTSPNSWIRSSSPTTTNTSRTTRHCSRTLFVSTVSFLRICGQNISGNVYHNRNNSSPSILQDHLSSGWFASKHLSDIDKYREGVQDASMHAPWKDSTWMDQVDEGEPSSKYASFHSNLGIVHLLIGV
jgi:hypothetical protein